MCLCIASKMARGLCIPLLLFVFAYAESYSSVTVNENGYANYLNKVPHGIELDKFEQYGLHIVGHYIRYRSWYYYMICDRNRLYRHYHACYERYGGIRYCLHRMATHGYLKKHVAHVPYDLYGATASASAHAHASAQGSGGQASASASASAHVVVHNGYFNYGGHRYRIRCSKRNFYDYWNRCYDHYHDGKRCCGLLQQDHIIVSASASASAQASGSGGQASASASAQARVTVVNGYFNYHGQSYKLLCTKQKFYDYWNPCYNKYHDGYKCCRHLMQKQIIVSASASASSQASSSGGGTASASASARAQVNIVNGYFNYGGYRYKLKCTPKTFYNYWNPCYAKYHDGKYCCGYLLKQNIIVSASASASSQASSSGSGTASASASARAQVNIVNGYFNYGGYRYKLKCTPKTFYNYWNPCYAKHHDGKYCCGYLLKQNIIVSASASASSQASSSGGGTASASASARAHVNIVNGYFNYGGYRYKLKCTPKTFYNYWNPCYAKYHDGKYCCGSLLKQNIIVSASASASSQASSSGVGSKASAQASASAQIKVVNGFFNYGGHRYRVKCRERDFYDYWSRCYNLYHDGSRCCDLLQQQHVIVTASASASSHASSSGSGSASASASAHAQVHIVNGYFNYGGYRYKLGCSEKKFYDYWNPCYAKYHDGAKCCRYLLKQNIIVSASASASSQAFSSGSGSASASASARAQVHIVKGYFNYGGYRYKLGCSEKKFYDYWNPCYAKYHDGNKCCRYLLKQNIIVSASASASSQAFSSGSGSASASASARAQVHILNGYFNYGGYRYRLGCSEKKFYDYWNPCYTKYHDGKKCCRYLLKQKIILSASASASSQAFSSGGGTASASASARAQVNIVNGYFNYGGYRYKLKCTPKTFYNYWNPCYAKYHDGRRCCSNLLKQNIIVSASASASSQSSSSGSGSASARASARAHVQIVNGYFNYGGYRYKLKCTPKTFYNYWNPCYAKYHDGRRCCSNLLKQNIIVSASASASSQASSSGSGSASASASAQAHVQIVNGYFNYGGYRYKLKCTPKTFYNYWKPCYAKYHDGRRCCSNLLKQNIIVSASASASSQASSSGSGSASARASARAHVQIVNGYFNYGGYRYKLKCTPKTFYNYWNPCYAKYHDGRRCCSNLLKQNIIVSASASASSQASSSGSGSASARASARAHVQIVNGYFNYGGYRYKLKCTPKTFYNYWNPCYAKYHDGRRCCGNLLKQNIIVSASASASSQASSSGSGSASASASARAHVQIVNGYFNYGGYRYKLKCTPKTFYNYWNPCYAKYHDGRRCCSNLLKQNIIVSASASASSQASSTGSGSASARASARAHVQIVNGYFNYGGYRYKLKCTPKTFYNYWNPCYAKYHDGRRCCSNLLKQNIIVSASASASSHASSSGSGSASAKASARVHVQIVNGYFNYGGYRYKLRCTPETFYNYWNHCYDKYHDGNKCCGYLKKQHVIIAASASASSQASSSGGGSASASASARAHVNIVNGYFNYGGYRYKLKCTPKTFYNYWNPCYSKYHDGKYCCGYLLKRNIIVSASASASASSNAVSSGTSHASASASARAFVNIVHGGFNYGGKFYKLDCDKKKFYSAWNKCYGKYKSWGRCCGYLQNNHYIHATASASASASSNAVSSGTSQASASASARAFVNIVHGGFNYGGKFYKLDCDKKKFYSAWNKCYGKYKSWGRCCGYLQNNHYIHASAIASSSASANANGGFSHVAAQSSAQASAAVPDFPFQIFHGGFIYHKKPYHLKCTKGEFYLKFKDCWNRRHSMPLCLQELFHDHLYN